MSNENETKQLLKNIFFVSKGNLNEVKDWLNLFYEGDLNE